MATAVLQDQRVTGVHWLFLSTQPASQPAISNKPTMTYSWNWRKHQGTRLIISLPCLHIQSNWACVCGWVSVRVCVCVCVLILKNINSCVISHCADGATLPWTRRRTLATMTWWPCCRSIKINTAPKSRRLQRTQTRTTWTACSNTLIVWEATRHFNHKIIYFFQTTKYLARRPVVFVFCIIGVMWSQCEGVAWGHVSLWRLLFFSVQSCCFSFRYFPAHLYVVMWLMLVSVHCHSIASHNIKKTKPRWKHMHTKWQQLFYRGKCILSLFLHLEMNG